MRQPVVSVVTPFRNTAPYLAECIESVLGQSFTDFEYILSDNCSTDGSWEIAESYARRDSRIRVVRQLGLVAQPRHYNLALSEISPASLYCKVVQADDYIFPECLRLMVQSFEQSETIGLVSSYDMKGSKVRGSGFPYPATMLPGKQVGRLYLDDGLFPFGSTNTVMYRSSLIRNQFPFFDESALHEDTEKCMQILARWDFGFVHQILSFMRTDNVNESISAAAHGFVPDELDRYITVRKFAAMYLGETSAEATKKKAKRAYYRVLAKSVLRGRGAAFWEYHRKGLQTLNEEIDSVALAGHVVGEVAAMIVNPGATISRGLRLIGQKLRNAKIKEQRSLREVSVQDGIGSAVTGPTLR